MNLLQSIGFSEHPGSLRDLHLWLAKGPGEAPALDRFEHSGDTASVTAESSSLTRETRPIPRSLPIETGSDSRPAPESSAVQAATKIATEAADRDEVRKIFLQMASDRKKAQAEIWTIWYDTQTEIFKIMQEAWLNRAKAVQKSIDAWNEYLFPPAL